MNLYLAAVLKWLWSVVYLVSEAASPWNHKAQYYKVVYQDFLHNRLINLSFFFFPQGHLEPQELQGKRETLVSWACLETRAQQGRRVTRETKGTCPMMCSPQVRGWCCHLLLGWMGPEIILVSCTKAALGHLSLSALDAHMLACFRVLCFWQGENHV